MIRIETPALNAEALKPFIDLPCRIHSYEPDKVRFTREYELSVLLNAGLFGASQRVFIAYDDDVPVARVVAGIDDKLNRKLGTKNGSLCMFECDSGLDYAFAILDAACLYLKQMGMDTVTGPDSATVGSFCRGLLTEGFGEQPYVLDGYNNEEYAFYFEKYGFVKHRDYYSFRLNLGMFDVISAEMLSSRAQKRFGFTVKHADVCSENADGIVRDIEAVIRSSCPPKWETALPDSASLSAEINLLKPLLVPELTVMAYSGNQPIGFVLVLPDGKRGCKSARCCMQFVVPEYRHKAVNIAMFHEAYLQARKLGIREIEAGQIDETNVPSLNYIKRMGAKKLFTWRQYEKKL